MYPFPLHDVHKHNDHSVVTFSLCETSRIMKLLLVACLLILAATAYPTKMIRLTDRGLYFPQRSEKVSACPDGQRRTSSGLCRKVFIKP